MCPLAATAAVEPETVSASSLVGLEDPKVPNQMHSLQLQ